MIPLSCVAPKSAIKIRQTPHRAPSLKPLARPSLPPRSTVRSVRVTASVNDPRLPTVRQPGDTVGGYVIERHLGRGGSGVTYLGRSVESEFATPVAIKCLSLRSLQGWKALDLFEREAKTLKALDHPGIPRYVDSFELDSEADKEFVLVQENANGKSLRDLISEGWRPTEDAVIDIAVQLLDILKYLGSLRPPVIHRDIGPSNVVVEGGREGGKVFLIDFGGVQEASASGDFLGSTVIGTYGFGAPEQFRGAARPESDAYGVGATLLFLISGGKSPLAFPQRKLRVDFRPSVVCSARLATVIEGLLEPAPEDRMDPQTARKILLARDDDDVARYISDGARGRNDDAPSSSYGGDRDPSQYAVMGGRKFRIDPTTSRINEGSLLQPDRAIRYVDDDARLPGWTGKIMPRKKVDRPPGARSVVTATEGVLTISIPAKGFGTDSLFLGAFATAWNSFLVFWLFSALSAGGGIVAALFTLPFWAAGGMVVTQFLGSFVKSELVITKERYRLDKKLAFINRDGSADWTDENTKKFSGDAGDLVGSYVDVKGAVNNEPVSVLVVDAGQGRLLELGEGLSLEENEWLSYQIAEFVKKL